MTSKLLALLFVTTAFAANNDRTLNAEIIKNGAGVFKIPTATLAAGVMKNDGTGALSSSAVDLATEVTGTLPIASGGTGQTSATASLNALLPSQAGHAGEYLTTDGVGTVSWVPITLSFAANKWITTDGSGNLQAQPDWSVNSYNGEATYLTVVQPADAGDVYAKFHEHEAEIDTDGISTLQFHPSNVSLNAHVDRTGSGGDLDGGVTNLSLALSTEGAGNVETVDGISSSLSLGVGNPGTAGTAHGIQQTISVGAGYAADVLAGLNQNINVDATGTLGDLDQIFSSVGGDITGNYRGLALSYVGDVGGTASTFSTSQTGDVTGNATGLTVGFNGNSADFTGIALNSQGTTRTGQEVGIQLGLSNANTTGKTAINLNLGNGTHSGGGRFIEANAGSGTYTNWIGLNLNHGAIDAGGSETGVNIGKSTVDSLIYTGLNFPNNGPATTLWTGILMNNYPTTGTVDYRGLQIAPSGAFTASTMATGLDIDMQNVTVTGGAPRSITTNAGVVAINSSRAIPSGAGGVFNSNQILMSSTTSGDITGTDYISNGLIGLFDIDHNVDAGTIGLGLSQVGFIGQLDIAATKTVARVNGVVSGFGTLGTGTVTNTGGYVAAAPFPSGLTVTNYRAFELLSGFTSGATNNWGVWIGDEAMNNYLGRLSIGTETVDPGVKLQILDGHVKVEQTAAPVATPDANAGTGATCTATGADSAGHIQLVTGSAAWASGAQCAAAFDESFGAAPKCTFSPTNATAAGAAANVYISKTVSALTINFVAADTGANTYEWDYICVEN